MAVSPIALAIAECAKVVGNWQVSKERRYLRASKDASEQYIFVDEKAGEYADITDEKQKKLKKKFRKRFFKFN